VPLLNEISVDDVEAMLRAMDDADLITRYTEAGRDSWQVPLASRWRALFRDVALLGVRRVRLLLEVHRPMHK